MICYFLITDLFMELLLILLDKIKPIPLHCFFLP